MIFKINIMIIIIMIILIKMMIIVIILIDHDGDCRHLCNINSRTNGPCSAIVRRPTSL